MKTEPLMNDALVNKVAFTAECDNVVRKDFVDEGVNMELVLSPKSRPAHLPRISPGSRSLGSPFCNSPSALLTSPTNSMLHQLPSPVCMLDVFSYKQDYVGVQKMNSFEEPKVNIEQDNSDSSHKEIVTTSLTEVDDSHSNQDVKCDKRKKNGEEQSQAAISSSSKIIAKVSAACAASSSPPPASEPPNRGLVSRRGGRAGSVRTFSVPIQPENESKHQSAAGSRKIGNIFATTSPHSLPSLVTSSECHSGTHMSSSSSSCSQNNLPPESKDVFRSKLKEVSRLNRRDYSVDENHIKHEKTTSEVENSSQKPLSITIDPSCEASPLKSREIDELRLGNISPVVKESLLENQPVFSPKINNENHMTLPLSPIPSNTSTTKKDEENHHKPNMSQLHFHDKIGSSSPLFLSPYSPASLGVIGDSPFVRSASNNVRDSLAIGDNDSIPLMSPRHMSSNRDRVETETPTNFVSELDSANPAFSWLNSPHLLPLTPKRDSLENQNDPRFEPPISSFPSSFFPQDDARRNNSSSKGNVGSRSIQSQHPYASMICISPLASSRKHRQEHSSNSSSRSPYKRDNNRCAIDIFQEIFSSPRISSNQNISPSSRTLLPLDLNSTNEYGESLNLDIADRDLIEDEDLSVLLHLASNPANKSPSTYYPRPRQRHPYSPTNGIDTSSLQLPLIHISDNRMESPTNACPPHHYSNASSQIPIPMRRRRTSKDSLTGMTPNSFSEGDARIPGGVDINYKMAISDKKNKKQQKKRRTNNVMLKPKFSFDNENNREVKPLSSLSSAMKPSNHKLHPQSGKVCRIQQSVGPNPNIMFSHSKPEQIISQQNRNFHMNHPVYGNNSQLSRTSVTPYADQLRKKVTTKRPLSDIGKSVKKKQRNENSTRKRQGSTMNKNSVSNRQHKDTGVDTSCPTIDLAATAASGGKNAQAAALAAAILRGVTMRPSGKWQAQLYYAGKSRYIGVFDSREKAALAYEIAREKLKSESSPGVVNCVEDTEAAVKLAREAAFEGVNQPDHRILNRR